MEIKSRKEPRESRKKNQRETEEMYKSLSSGFNLRQISNNFLPEFFTTVIFIKKFTRKNLWFRSRRKRNERHIHVQINKRKNKNRLTAVTFVWKTIFINLCCFVFPKRFYPEFSSKLKKNEKKRSLFLAKSFADTEWIM